MNRNREVKRPQFHIQRPDAKKDRLSMGAVLVVWIFASILIFTGWMASEFVDANEFALGVERVIARWRPSALLSVIIGFGIAVHFRIKGLPILEKWKSK